MSTQRGAPERQERFRGKYAKSGHAGKYAFPMQPTMQQAIRENDAIQILKLIELSEGELSEVFTGIYDSVYDEILRRNWNPFHWLACNYDRTVPVHNILLYKLLEQPEAERMLTSYGSDGYTPIHNAVTFLGDSLPTFLETVCQKHPNVLYRRTSLGTTTPYLLINSLRRRSYGSSLAALKVLASHGAKLNEPNARNSDTPLHAMAHMGRQWYRVESPKDEDAILKEIATFLREQSDDPNRKNKHGQSALDVAAMPAMTPDGDDDAKGWFYFFESL